MKQKHLLASVVLCVVSLFSLPAMASEKWSASFEQCMDRSGGVTDLMNICLEEEKLHWREQVRKMQQKITREERLVASQKARAKRMQKEFEQYVGSACELVYKASEGSAALLVAKECEASLWREHARWLQTVVE